MGLFDDDWGSDFGNGFKKPFAWAYDKGAKLFNSADKTSDKLLDALPNIADDLSGLLKNPIFNPGQKSLVFLRKCISRTNNNQRLPLICKHRTGQYMEAHPTLP